MPGSPGLRPVGVTAVVVLYFAINAVVVLYFAVALGVVSDVSSMNAASVRKVDDDQNKRSKNLFFGFLKNTILNASD